MAKKDIYEIISAWAETYRIEDPISLEIADALDDENIIPTAAQLKVMAAYADTIHYQIVDGNYPDYDGWPVYRSLIKTLKLVEPRFLETFLWMTRDGGLGATLLCRYLTVCNTECMRNTLKTLQTANDKVIALKRADREHSKVYEYALYTPYGTEPIRVDNAYKAAWYIVANNTYEIELIGEYSNKQLKDALSNPEAIDRYAMIRARDYEEEISYQAAILHAIKTALFKYKVHMHVFHESTELAEEGIRMHNCIATYWDHDGETALFSVDYEDAHMDVEVCHSYDTPWDAWCVAQVYEAHNTESERTATIKRIISGACDNFNAERYIEYRKRSTCAQFGCEKCIYKSMCYTMGEAIGIPINIQERDHTPVTMGDPEDAGVFDEDGNDVNIADDIITRRAVHEYDLMCHLYSRCEMYDINDAGMQDLWRMLTEAPVDIMAITTRDVDRLISDYMDR